MKLDRFDILVIAAVIALTGAAVVVGASAPPSGAVDRVAVARAKALPPDPALYARLDELRRVIESGQPREALGALDAMASEHPELSEPHALMGEAFARMLDYPSAMKQYKMALMLDPGYVDKKSPRFIGKRIKAAQRDGLSEAKAKLDRDASDASAKSALKDAYYLERMLAGGCE